MLFFFSFIFYYERINLTFNIRKAKYFLEVRGTILFSFSFSFVNYLSLFKGTIDGFHLA
jgi:hypothetical protein